MVICSSSSATNGTVRVNYGRRRVFLSSDIDRRFSERLRELIAPSDYCEVIGRGVVETYRGVPSYRVTLKQLKTEHLICLECLNAFDEKLVEGRLCPKCKSKNVEKLKNYVKWFGRRTVHERPEKD